MTIEPFRYQATNVLAPPNIFGHKNKLVQHFTARATKCVQGK
jgi:hypothetical protein